MHKPQLSKLIYLGHPMSPKLFKIYIQEILTKLFERVLRPTPERFESKPSSLGWWCCPSNLGFKDPATTAWLFTRIRRGMGAHCQWSLTQVEASLNVLMALSWVVWVSIPPIKKILLPWNSIYAESRQHKWHIYVVKFIIFCSKVICLPDDRP